MTITTNFSNIVSRQKYFAYSVSKPRDGKRGFWKRIGIATAHLDGKGFTILTDVVPLDGQVVLRIATEKK